MVNGYQCKDCTDIDNAKKHIDPKHPKSGPFGVNAKDDPTSPDYNRDAAVKAGGAVGNLTANPVQASTDVNTASGPGSATQRPTQPLSQQTGKILHVVA
jgi:hypothetical protein